MRCTNDLVLAIRPRHWRHIRDGVKTLELRRSRPSRTPRRIYLYVTKPYQRVMGVVDCVEMRGAFTRLRKGKGTVNADRKRRRGGRQDGAPRRCWARGHRPPNKREARWLRDACVTLPEAVGYMTLAERPTGIRVANYRPIAGARLHEFGLTQAPQSWAWALEDVWDVE